MGWMGGLGQGLQGAGQIVMQQQQLAQQREIDAQNRALTAALQREQMAQTKQYQDAQLARLDQQDTDKRMQWEIGNTAEGQALSPEVAQARMAAGYGAFVNQTPAGTIESRVSSNAGGFGVPALPQGAPEGQLPPTPLDTFSAIPTQDARMRTAYINQQGADGRAAQRYALQERLAAAKNALDTQELQVRQDANQVTRDQGLQRIAIARQQLGLAAQSLQFNMDKTLVDQGLRLDSNDTAAYRAQYGGGDQGGADMSALLMQMLQGPQGGAGTPAAPLVAPPPQQERPPIPRANRPNLPASYRPGGGTPAPAPKARTIAPPKGKK